MISRAARVPAPVYFVLAGLVVGAIPGIGVIRLPPDVVFYGFLPPLLYAAAFQTVAVPHFADKCSPLRGGKLRDFVSGKRYHPRGIIDARGPA